MSLRCPKCSTPLPQGRILLFLRLFSFKCAQCGSELALTGRGRAILVGSIVAAILLGFLVKQLTASETYAVIAIVAGFAASCVVTWRTAELGVLVDRSEDQTN